MTKILRRQFLHLAAGAAVLPAASWIARAQPYPSRPVRLLVGFGAGGAPDILARLMAQWLSDRLGQPFVVENRVGGSSGIATEAVVQAPADGQTLLLASLANAVNATLYDKLNYNFIRDIAPVGGISRDPNVMVVEPSFPAKTVPEFIAYAKASPGKINMASPGVGTSPHMAGELFKYMTGVDMAHVAYRGSPPALTDLLAGQVQVYFAPISAAIGYVRDGRLRALAVTTASRTDALPDVPTVAEFVPGYDSSGFYGIAAPQEHAGRHRRQAQQRDQCRPRRCHAEEAACRSRLRGISRLACRFRQARCRRNREMGEGDQIREHQAGVIGSK